ncbi:YncE family protein [Dysgonomonas sp. Marseille-P4361]|uniref:YncE family protein n=1 Tax=Dysgonomonas sp. Marseille-P4361 TaxID=2161820 RepID=UPI000D5576A1|nr:hypothetical protein [Dysgonomonas sp. Marseille-P4361]
MKKFLLYGVLTSILALGFASCSNDDDTDPRFEEKTGSVYILNSGKHGDNNSNLGIYNPETKEYSKNIFKGQNNMLLGGTANDMVVYGSKMYIAVTTSNKIYITDLKGKLQTYSDGSDVILDPKNDKDEPAEPRFATAYDGKVYVSTKAGYVLRIDTTSMQIDAKVKVGSYPEQMTAINNTLYVPNSGYGDGNTVSIVNLSGFTVSSTLDVTQNPSYTTTDNSGNVYILSLGKTWGGSNVKSQIQVYNPSSKSLSVVGTDIASKMVMSKDKNKLFLLKEIWGEEGAAHKIVYYDINSKILVDKEYFKLPESMKGGLDKAFSMSVDPISGDVYISTSDYTNNGDMYIFSADGTFKDKFDTAGINPVGAYFPIR